MPLLVKLAVWTAIVVAVWIVVHVAVFAWLPTHGLERHERTLRPESGAYPDVRLRATRRLWHWGRTSRLLAKGAWTATAKIDLPGANDSTILEYDAHREEWRWGRPPVLHRLQRIEREISPRDVVEWLKDAGVDTRRPGVEQEAAELIDLLKGAASGIQPEGGYFTFLPEGRFVETKIGPFTLVGPAASGFEGGSDLQGWHYFLIAGLFLAVWYPGLRIIVRRHGRLVGTENPKGAT